MPDRYSTNTPSLTGPAVHAFPITPNDAADLPEVTRALYIGGAGAVVLRLSSGQTVTFAGLSAGSLLPVRADRVLAVGTTATGLVGMV